MQDGGPERPGERGFPASAASSTKAAQMSLLQRSTNALATIKSRIAEAAWSVLEFHQNLIEPMQDTNRIPVVLGATYFSDDAQCHGIGNLEKNFPASLSQDTYADILAARGALERNSNWQAVELSPDLDCEGLDNAIGQSPTWRTGHEVLIVYRHLGLYLRLSDKHNCQAIIELEVLTPEGFSIPTPSPTCEQTQMTHTLPQAGANKIPPA